MSSVKSSTVSGSSNKHINDHGWLRIEYMDILLLDRDFTLGRDFLKKNNKKVIMI